MKKNSIYMLVEQDCEDFIIRYISTKKKDIKEAFKNIKKNRFMSYALYEYELNKMYDGYVYEYEKLGSFNENEYSSLNDFIEELAKSYFGKIKKEKENNENINK